MTSIDSHKVIDQTSRLLDYLSAVARHLYVDPVRDIRDYEPLITPSQIPHHSRVHIGPTSSNDAWLSIPRLTEPIPPDLSADLEGFVAVESVQDLDNQPRFLAELGEPDEDLLGELDSWVQDYWLPWALKARPIRAARKLYDRVFTLNLRAQRDLATHELVWGHAVLSWSGPKVVLSPVIVTKVNIEVDDDGTLHVRRDGLPELEVDALEGLSIDGLEELSRLRARLMESQIDPWSAESVDEIRKQFVAPLGLTASRIDSNDLLTPNRELRVNNGWVLYLRKRPVRHDRFYSELADVLKAGDFLPESMASIVADEKRLAKALDELDLISQTEWESSARRLLMPLATNIDQERIATQLAGARGVTVQGPPGTGKSHTIVNLVSHLIAHGKRVLVTAQNEQALSVLRNKFPAELRDLTVSVLGSTPKAMDELHSSVQVVMDIASQTDIGQEEQRMKALGDQIDAAREELRKFELKIVDALRDETREFQVRDRRMSAPELAVWLAANESNLGRIQDSISEDSKIPLSNQEISELYELVRTLEPADIDAYGLNRPKASSLPTSQELRNEVERIDELQRKLMDLEDSGLEIESVDKSSTDELNNLAENLELAADRLKSISLPWLAKTRELVRSSNESLLYWQDQVDTLSRQNRTCDEYRRAILGHEVVVPDGDPRVQLDLLTDLDMRFKYGKSVPRLGAKPLRNLYDMIKFDGYSLRTPTEVSIVQDSIRLRTEQRAMNVRLGQLSQENGMPIPAMDAQFNNEAELLISKIRNAIEWETEYKQKLNSDLAPFFGKNKESDDPESIRKAAMNLRAAASRHEERLLSKKHAELLKLLKMQSASNDASPMWLQLMEAQTGRDWGRWRLVLEESERLSALGSKIEKLHSLDGKLAKVAPRWSLFVREQRADVEVCGQPDEFPDFWLWRQADTWLKNLHSSSDLDNSIEAASKKQLEISRLVLDLAKRSAAVGVKKNMEDTKRRALQTWLQALQKRGKGTGKYAPHWEAVARKELPVAMGAIPVWIMPIHRVIENFDPRRSELFDVVIVDESSQCDLLSVGVLALGRKAIIVGDDKQTSPSGVGVDQQEIIKLQDMYINDVDGKSLLTVTESLYGIAERVFSNVILLKEHFRCLPEIINFSNRYYDNRILPLRERPDRDLGPILNAVYVNDAVCVGSGPNRVNKSEATALIEKIIECCNSSVYDGLTFGVVTMLGNGQAQYIESRLIEALGIDEYQRRQLRVGNPAVFQGDERSVIFISMVADDNSYAATRTQDKQRVNVAASRAQDQLWVFYSVDPSTLNANDERRALIQYALNTGRTDELPADQFELCESEFERRVLRDILSRGYKVKPQHPVGSYRIDMVVYGSNKRIAVECDGDTFHGPDQWDEDIKRQRVLERLGWNFWRIRASEYWRNPVSALEPLWERLGEVESFDPVKAEVNHEEQVIIYEQDVERIVNLEPSTGSEATESVEHTKFETTEEPQHSRGDSYIAIWEEHLGRKPDLTFGDYLGGIWLDIETDVEVKGTPMASQNRDESSTGLQCISKVSYRNGILTLAFTSWDTGSWQVECLAADGVGANVRRLTHGGRLGVYKVPGDDLYFAELRIMKPGSGMFTTAQNPKKGELDRIIGWSLNERLQECVDFEMVTTREKLFADTGNRRTTPIAVWRNGGSEIPILIYAATRILPLFKLDGML